MGGEMEGYAQIAADVDDIYNRETLPDMFAEAQILDNPSLRKTGAKRQATILANQLITFGLENKEVNRLLKESHDQKTS